MTLHNMSPSEPRTKLTRAHVYITGRVQGVGFRAAAWHKATSTGVNGWVRNLPDGRVEAVFEGEPTLVEEMVQWCHQGSSAARVREVNVENEEPQGLSGFEVRY